MKNPLNYMATLQQEAIWSAGLVLVLFVLSYVATWALSRKQSLEQQRFWRLTFRHIATVACVLGLVIIWRHQLQNFIVALGAATAGLLLTLRENWMSLTAFWVRVGRRHYGLDDFIEIDGVRGRVQDITWLTTVLAETGPGKEGLAYSGRVIHIPNYRMLLSPLFVENLTGTFSAHIVNIPLPLGADAIAAEKLLLTAATRYCEPYYAEAEQHMSALQRAQALDTPSIEPKTHIRVVEEGALVLALRIVVPFAEKLRIEQSIMRDFLQSTTEVEWPKPVAK